LPTTQDSQADPLARLELGQSRLEVINASNGLAANGQDHVTADADGLPVDAGGLCSPL
jgi:hypothetical protein